MEIRNLGTSSLSGVNYNKYSAKQEEYDDNDMNRELRDDEVPNCYKYNRHKVEDNENDVSVINNQKTEVE